MFNSAQYPELGYTPCVDGFAAAIPGDVNNTFRCDNVSSWHHICGSQHPLILYSSRSTSTTSSPIRSSAAGEAAAPRHGAGHPRMVASLSLSGSTTAQRLPRSHQRGR